jgi:archaellum component FlaC
MTQSTQERQENTYTIRNRDASTRTVVIEHPARPGWKLTDDEKPAESSTSFHRFRLTVDSKKTETLTVKEYRPITNNYQLSNVTDDQIKFFAAQKMITAEIDQALRKVISQKNAIAALDAEMTSRRAKISGISEDQQRVRENMKALKGSVEEKALVARYVRELNEQEDHVQSLQHEVADLQQKRDTAQKTLNDMIEGLQMEATL